MVPRPEMLRNPGATGSKRARMGRETGAEKNHNASPEEPPRETGMLRCKREYTTRSHQARAEPRRRRGWEAPTSPELAPEGAASPGGAGGDCRAIAKKSRDDDTLQSNKSQGKAMSQQRVRIQRMILNMKAAVTGGIRLSGVRGGEAGKGPDRNVGPGSQVSGKWFSHPDTNSPPERSKPFAV